MKAVFTAIKTAFNVANPFKTAISGRMRYGEAPEEWGTLDYAVYMGTGTPAEDTFDTTIDVINWQIVCISTDSGVAEANVKLAEDLFNGKTLSVTGYQGFRCRRVNKIPAIKDEEKWMSVVEFEGRLIAT